MTLKAISMILLCEVDKVTSPILGEELAYDS